jgi:hypothetical protein
MNSHARTVGGGTAEGGCGHEHTHTPNSDQLTTADIVLMQ